MRNPEIDLTRLSRVDRALAYFADTMNFFHEGWGDVSALQNLIKTDPQLPAAKPVDLRWTKEWDSPAARHRSGVFRSPFEHAGFPKECLTARVEFVLPKSGPERPPVCLHFAATGDTGLRRRRDLMAIPLARHGIASLLLENPYYGDRRPREQRGFSPRHFTDLWTMAQATVQEGLSLLNWLEARGYEKRGVTGISMGGYMASLVASAYPQPLASVPCIAPHSGTPVFTQGVLTKACNWAALTRDRSRADAMEFMRLVFLTSDIRYFPTPKRPQACVLVAGRYDAYIPPYSPELTHRHWKGSEIVWLETGHVGAFFFKRRRFIDAIAGAFERL